MENIVSVTSTGSRNNTDHDQDLILFMQIKNKNYSKARNYLTGDL